MIIIPAIDLKGGRCVRLYQGDFDNVTEYDENPANVARRFSTMGFEYLHVVDLDGARDGCQKNQKCIRAIASATSMSVQIGGGIRDEETLERWFSAGVARCVIGSLAVRSPAIVKRWIRRFSADRIVLALDVRLDESAIPRLATNGWTETTLTSLWDCVDDYLDSGLQHVLCTDVSRDGAMTGPSLDLYEAFVQRYPAVKLQASGGVRSIADLESAAKLGAAAAITGRALLDGCISAEEIASFPQSE